MTKYTGTLKTKAQADAWAKKLRQHGSAHAIGAASMLASNWAYIAARPALQPVLIAMMLEGAESCDSARPGSIMNRILQNNAERS